METEPHQPRLERFVDDQITAQHMADASRLFSLHYGVWGPLASTHLGKWARQGKRVQLSPVRLRRECCAELTGRGRGRREREEGGQGRVTDVHNECVRAVVGAEGGGNGGEVEVVGHVLATRWTVPIDSTAAADFSDRDRQPVHVCWITQVVVHAARRRKGIATAMLRLIHSATLTPTLPSTLFAILTSHAATLRACARAFKNGASLLDDGVLDLALIRRLAPPLVRGAPVKYVCEAEVRGSLFDSEGEGERGGGRDWLREMREEEVGAQGELREEGKDAGRWRSGAVASAYARFYLDH
ncbi:hypothetical protein IWX46DRAFT_668395, partial [Phyllosticta citricarpa]